jgi:Outer membrane protein
MKHFIFLLVCLVFSYFAMAQSTLEECQQLSQKNYPLISNYGLIDQSSSFTISNVAKAWLPQISFSAQASYQSDVTSFPDQIMQVYQKMGINIHALNKDQYKLALDVNQTLWDAGASKAKRNIALSQAEAQKASLDVDMYAIRIKINDLFFGVLLLYSQLEQNKLSQELLKSNLAQVKAMVANGTAMQCEADAIEAELLTLMQQEGKICSSRDAFLQMLSLFTGKQITSIKEPEEANIQVQDCSREELVYIEKLNESISAQESLIKSSTLPQLYASFQGLYGNPGLNFFKDMTQNKWSLNYIAGIKFQWNFGAFYTKSNNLQALKIARAQNETQRQTFLFNNKIQATSQQREIARLRKEIENDNQIVSLRASVRKAYESKLAGGTINITELLQQITAESIAKNNEASHHIELLKNIYDLKYILNK